MNQLNDAGLALIKSFESWSPTPYTDQAGKPTVGWGHQGQRQLTC